jgi:hypothetical protein
MKFVTTSRAEQPPNERTWDTVRDLLAPSLEYGHCRGGAGRRPIFGAEPLSATHGDSFRYPCSCARALPAFEQTCINLYSGQPGVNQFRPFFGSFVRAAAEGSIESFAHIK